MINKIPDYRDVLVLAPFRRAVFRNAVSSLYPFIEPIDSPPLLVAGAIQSKGLGVNYFPLINLFNGYNEETDYSKLYELLKNNPSKMVVFSADNFIPSRSTASVYGIRTISRILRDINPRVIVGVTGRMATVLKEKLYKIVPELDFSIIGEPEEVIGDIAEEILINGLGAADKKFNSLLTKNNVNKVPVPAMVMDLENMALPAYELLEHTFEIYEDLTGIKPKNIPFSIRTTLGCKFRCRFCSGVPNWLNYRKKSPERIDKEIKRMKRFLGEIATISFLEDEIFTKDIEHVKKVTNIFKENGIFLEGLYTHSSLMSAEIAQLLLPITNRVYFGLDNANDNILKKMGKGQKLDTVLHAIELARGKGLKVHLEWIIGTPEEDIDSLLTSLTTIFNLLSTGIVDNINTYVYCPHPGTEYAMDPEKYNLNIVEDFDYMQESGGYPTYSTDKLNRNQIFTAYLMSQLIIIEAKQAREHSGIKTSVRFQNKKELRYLFNSISGTQMVDGIGGRR
ncbi:B12-binding domain-containing radical SAM protein [Bacillus albus]|uniref:B12-binding domain-containing radical SAM protein n=1 Tax=Bacillus albus TaxID=2026189 RepID=UPI0035C97B45